MATQRSKSKVQRGKSSLVAATDELLPKTQLLRRYGIGREGF